MSKQFSMGLDYGSNSVRCLIIDVADGTEYGVCVAGYPSGDAGVLTDPRNPHVARQNPADFLTTLEQSVAGALAEAAAKADFAADRIIGIGVDTTGSTPLPVDATMQPLAFRADFADDLDAMAWMWKDHSGMDEAEAITKLAAQYRPQYLAKCGGTYSSEWLFSKVWHCLKVNPKVFEAAYTWLEFADYIPAVLAGLESPDEVKRCVCAAGHKAMYNATWGGFPDEEFLGLLDPQLADLRPRLGAAVLTVRDEAGQLCEAWAAKLGLPAGIPIAVGAFDAHLGAVGAGVKEGSMVKIIGTSTCDALVAPKGAELPDIPGVCGIVDGSILPDYYAIEAGQSAVGDIFNWFVKVLCEGDDDLFAKLTAEAQALSPGESGLLALDWHNGNRCILVDARLSGLILGFTLHTRQAAVFRTLIEATAFGARRILDRIEEYGVPVHEIINCGGIAEKNPLFMQIYADVLGRPMKVSASSQTCALGSALVAAVVGGAYPDATTAQESICRFKDHVYEPQPAAQAVYDELYALYCELHDSFGVPSVTFDHAKVMKRLLDIRANAAGH